MTKIYAHNLSNKITTVSTKAIYTVPIGQLSAYFISGQRFCTILEQNNWTYIGQL